MILFIHTVSELVVDDYLLQPRKGRGAVSNLQGRFDLQLREDFDDGWNDGGQRGLNDADGDSPDHSGTTNNSLQTHITRENVRSILTRNSSPDVPFNVSLNPYRGCEHGCIYCFARPTHSYLELSPGLDFETRLFAKVNAAELLRQELAHPAYRPEPIALGVNTDAYQPCERSLRITRAVLEVLHECEHPVALISKSALLERDLDLLVPMARKGLVSVTMTITTLDHDIARTLEPRAASPMRRLQTVQRLSEAGVPVGVNVAPVIPFITDQDLEGILEAAVKAGAIGASYIILRLPWEISPLFRQWLQVHYPDRAERVMNRIRDMRGGKDYQAGFGKRMSGEGIWAELIRQRFDRAVRRTGIQRKATRFHSLDVSRFRRPLYVPRRENSTAQLDMF